MVYTIDIWLIIWSHRIQTVFFIYKTPLLKSIYLGSDSWGAKVHPVKQQVFCEAAIEKRFFFLLEETSLLGPTLNFKILSFEEKAFLKGKVLNGNYL